MDCVGQRKRSLLGQFEGDPGRRAQRRVEHVDIHGVAVGGMDRMVDVDRCLAGREPARRTLPLPSTSIFSVR